MEAVNTSACGCELCNPNLHLGEPDEVTEVEFVDESIAQRKEKAAQIVRAATQLVFAD